MPPLATREPSSEPVAEDPIEEEAISTGGDAPVEPAVAADESIGVEGSLVLRILTKPMRLLPTSAQSLATAFAASLVVWVPIAWAWAVFSPPAEVPTRTGDALSAPMIVDTPARPAASATSDPAVETGPTTR